MEGRHVLVVGPGNSAGQSALYLSRNARQATMLVRGYNLARSMSDYLIPEIEAALNISVTFIPKSPTAMGRPTSIPSLARQAA